MAWLKLDDQIFYNRKVAQCDTETKMLYIVGLTYCAHQLTDGFIPSSVLPLLAGMAGTDWQIAKQNASNLLSKNLWVETEGGWTVPDFLEYNPSREQVLHNQAVRAEAGSRGGKAKHSKNLANSQQIAKQNSSKILPPSPSPSEDDDSAQALTDLQVLGLFNKTMLDQFNDMWPELSGRHDWIGKAITIARDNGASSPAYALKVLANSLHTGKEPGYVNGKSQATPAPVSHTKPDTAEKTRRFEEAGEELIAEGCTPDNDTFFYAKIEKRIEEKYGKPATR